MKYSASLTDVHSGPALGRIPKPPGLRSRLATVRDSPSGRPEANYAIAERRNADRAGDIGPYGSAKTDKGALTPAAAASREVQVVRVEGPSKNVVIRVRGLLRSSALVSDDETLSDSQS